MTISRTMLTLIALALAAALPPQPIRDFGHWTVGCDNGRECQAVALVPEDAPEGGLPFATLAVKRGAANPDLPVVAVEPAWDELGSIAGIIVDHQRTGFALEKDGSLQRAEDAMPLLRQLAAEQGAQIVDAAGKPVARVSLKGATAALRWMDEQQLRHWSGTAILAMGTGLGPQSTPALPRIQAAARSAKAPRRLRAADIANARKQADCQEGFTEPTTYHRLDAASTLAIVPCMIGAYQGSSIVLVVPDAGAWRPAPLEEKFFSDHPATSPFEAAVLTEPDLDPKTQSLWTSHKGRGIGDCGGTEAYVWNGAFFSLAYMAVMNSCGGSLVRIPIWRTANHPGD